MDTDSEDEDSMDTGSEDSECPYIKINNIENKNIC